MTTVRIIDFLDPAASSVATGEEVARRALAALATERQVRVDFSGFRGGASSLYNSLLHELRKNLGAAGVRERVDFTFDTTAQQVIFERSRDAVLRESA